MRQLALRVPTSEAHHFERIAEYTRVEDAW
jgi:hypothetical protein